MPQTKETTKKKKKPQKNTKIMRLLSSFPSFARINTSTETLNGLSDSKDGTALFSSLHLFPCFLQTSTQWAQESRLSLHRAFALLCIVLSCSQFFVFPILFFPCRRPSFVYLFLRHYEEEKGRSKIGETKYYHQKSGIGEIGTCMKII